MSVRRLIVSVDMEGLNVSEFCRQHGISRWSFYELRRRFAAEGVRFPRFPGWFSCVDHATAAGRSWLFS